MEPDEQSEPIRKERIPWQQMLMDDVFLLLGLGLAIPILIYIMWGLMDLASVKAFQP
jgi:hypothetical protein